ncbi:MAG: SOS response-associated peptidase [Actinomycetota bacterium]|nr:SOS response-associated peptidase [Actinomycetota bacterium]
MCGRYAASRDAVEVGGLFRAEQLPDVELPPRYNVAPTAESYIVLDHDGTRAVDIARWGLVPSWSKDASRASRMINARSETVAEKPAYRSAFKRRRCLVPVDGYYEWQVAGTSAPKQPFFIHAENDTPLALAGLYEDWDGPNGSMRTFTMLTQEPPSWLGRIHDRMPVIVQSDRWQPWLSTETSEADLDGLLADITRHSAQDLQAYPVATLVNRASHEGPHLTESIGPPVAVG